MAKLQGAKTVHLISKKGSKEEESFGTISFPRVCRTASWNDNSTGVWYDVVETTNTEMIGKNILDQSNPKRGTKYVKSLSEYSKINKQVRHSMEIIVPKKSPLIKNLMTDIKSIATANDFETGFKTFIKDGDVFAKKQAKAGKDGDMYKGYYKLQVKAMCNKPIKLIDKYGNDITNKMTDEQLTGCYINAIGWLFPYNKNNEGIGLFINAIQVLKKNQIFDFGSEPDTNAFNCIDNALADIAKEDSKKDDSKITDEDIINDDDDEEEVPF